MRARHFLAVTSSTPVTSNIMVPGLTMATQYSGSPLPLPIRVSSGLPETGLCGKMRMNSRPSRRRKCDAATRPASICRAVIHPGFWVCRPYSPNATVLPRVALPFILPRWLLRNFTRLGIMGIGHLSRSHFRSAILELRLGQSQHRFIANRKSKIQNDRLPAPAPRATTGTHVRLHHLARVVVVPAVDPHLHADRAERR